MIRFSNENQKRADNEKWHRLLRLEIDVSDNAEALKRKISELESRNAALEQGFNELKGVISV